MKGRKLVVLASICLILVLFTISILAACAKPAPAPAPGVAPTAAAPGTTYQLKWRMAVSYPRDTEGAAAAFRFADKVKAQTKGRVDITVYADSVLGGWDATNEMIIRGDIETMFEALDDSFDPRIAVGYYIPFVFNDYNTAAKFWATDGLVYNLLNGIVNDLNYRVLGAWNAGAGGLTLKSVPPSPFDPDVPKKVKIRTMALTASRLTFERLGYLVTTMPFGEVFTAIQTGIVEGQQGGGTMQAYIFRDVNKVYLDYRDYIEPVWFAANNKHWAKLTVEDQGILTSIAQEEQNLQFTAAKAMDEKYMKMLKDYGWTVLIPTDAEWKKMSTAIFKDVWPKLVPQIGKGIVYQLYDALGMPRPK